LLKTKLNHNFDVVKLTTIFSNEPRTYGNHPNQTKTHHFTSSIPLQSVCK